MNVPVKRGMLLRHHGHLFFVDNVTERHSGQQRPAIHIALHDAADGRHVERTLDELMPIEQVPWNHRTVQYLYAKGAGAIFMDSQSFEEVELGEDALGGFKPLLKEGDEYRILYAGDQPMRLDVPESVALRVEDTAAPTHAVGTSANLMKEAMLQHGVQTHVPLFIKTGDLVRINTTTRQYLGKAQA